MSDRLIEHLVRNGYLTSPSVIQAFRSINRAEFVPEKFVREAEADIPLPIGYGQTISQPATVAIMLELLDARLGQNVLDVGSGSGWTSALLAHIVGKEGRVIALERLPELSQMTRHNVTKFNFVKTGRVKCLVGNGYEGYLAEQPYDRILVSAAAESVPSALTQQLAVGGKMVLPVRHHLCFIERRGPDEYHQEEFPGFLFVPLVEKSV